MSLAIDPLDVVAVQEPTIQINQKKLFGVFQGGSDNVYYTYGANSNSNSQAIWNINVPSENIFIDRKIYLQSRVRLTFTGTTPDPAQNLLQSGFDAFRAFPLSNAMNTLTVQVNNGAVSINMADIIQALMRYATFDEQYYEFSNTPNMLDQSQTYEELTASNRNPLNSYRDSIDGAFQPRGSFPMQVISNTNTGAVIEAQLCEPLMISPLHFNRSHASGFIGVKQFTTQIVWNQNLAQKMWSHNPDSGSVITGLTVEFIDSPELLIRTITPSEITSLELPNLSVYPYHDVQRYITDVPDVLPNESDIRTTNAVQLSVIPRRIFLFVRRANGQETLETTDSFLSIEQISINFGNRSGLLSSATKRDLYNISKKNGCNLSWSQWSGDDMAFLSGSDNLINTGVGSVLSLYIPEDIALTNSDLLAPGVSERVNVQIQITYKNNHPTETITPQIFMVVDNEGLFTIRDGMGLAQIGVLTKEDVLQSEQRPGVEYEDVLDLYGGDFFSDVGMFLKKLPGGIREGAEFVKDDILPIAAAVAPLLGLGKGGRLQVIEGKSAQGGLMVGGRKMTRSDLRKRTRRR